MFDFLKAQAKQNDNLALHCGYGPVRFAIEFDADTTYAEVDKGGLSLSPPDPPAL